MEAIDLTHDDDGTYIPPAKRPRPCDDSDVEVVEEASSFQGTSEEVPEERQLGDGEELVVLRERGQVWNRHLPHIRAQCGVHPFTPENALQNAQHCDQCYCYICDVATTSCRAWGTGTFSSDHCNAHPDHSKYCMLRGAAQRLASPHTPAQPAGSSRPAQAQRSTGAQTAATLRRNTARPGRRSSVPVLPPSRLNAGRVPFQPTEFRAALLRARAIADSSFEKDSLSAQFPALPDPGTAPSGPSSAPADGSRQPSTASANCTSDAMLAAINQFRARIEADARARLEANASSSPSSAPAQRSRQPSTASTPWVPAAMRAAVDPSVARVVADARGLANASSSPSSTTADRSRQPSPASTHAVSSARIAAALLLDARASADASPPAGGMDAASSRPGTPAATASGSKYEPAIAAATAPAAPARTATASAGGASGAVAKGLQMACPPEAAPDQAVGVKAALRAAGEQGGREGGAEGCGGGPAAHAGGGPQAHAGAPPEQHTAGGAAVCAAGPASMPGIPGPPAQAPPEKAKADLQPLPMQPIAAAMLHPDPRTRQVLRHIGTLELPFKVKAPYDIPELRRRLIPFGAYRPFTGVTDPEQSKALSTRLHIETFFQAKKFMEFLPLPVPYTSAPDLPERVFPITLISSDGREKPLMFGLTFGQDMTWRDIAEAAGRHHLAACSPGKETVLFACQRYEDLTGRIAPRNAVLHHIPTLKESLTQNSPGDQQNLQGYVLMRISKAVQPSIMPTRVLIQSMMSDFEYHGAERLAFAVLLPLPEVHLEGGPAAHDAISRQLLHALQPYRREGMPELDPQACITLLRCDASGWPTREVDMDILYFGKRKILPKEWKDQQIVHMVAQWSPLGVELFHEDAWGTPEVHPSAAADILAGTRRCMKAEFYMDKLKQEWDRKPYAVLHELSNVCAASAPSEKKRIQQAKRGWDTPLAQCRLEILPAAHDEEGILQAEVYISDRQEVERLGSTCFGSILTSAPMISGPKAYAPTCHSMTPLFCLQDTMEVLLMPDPQAKAMYQELVNWEARVSGVKLGVTTLMEMLQAGERPAAPQPAGLTVQLHPYQRQALQFMLDSERLCQGNQTHFWAPIVAPRGETFWYSPVYRRIAADIPATPWGGFLAEEMGCGKTVEVLALILSNPARAATVSGTRLNNGIIKSRATIVICPVSLVGQWLEEAQSKLDGSLRLYMYHGGSRIRDARRLATDYDLVVTTYQTLGADWRAQNYKMVGSPLHAVRWHRVVLDESHTIKAGGAGQSQACCALKSARRWCCSGTPISTEIRDFTGQFAFLRVKLLSEKAYFNSVVNTSWQMYTRCGISGVCSGTNVLLYALGRMLMRHTKAQVVGGQAVSQLPPKTEEALAVSFSQQEAEVYLGVHAEARAAFERFLRCGSEHINRHLLSIMSLLGPLRRCCSGGALQKWDLAIPDLWPGQGRKRARMESNAAEAPAVAAEAAPDEGLLAPDEECSVCLNAFERPTITPCSHWFCRECILAEAEERQTCPLCRAGITAEALREGVMPRDDEVIGQAGQESGAQEEAPGPSTQGHPGAHKQQLILFESKLNVLLNELAAMRGRDPAAKALIFTQFHSTLSWLSVRLQQEGYGFRTISGSMPLKKRAQAIEAFQKDPPTTVFLLSMRSGAVGINLTAANHVFLMEPALNPALEDQAVGRAHRMGQTRPVTVKKFYIKGSAEERIMEIIEQRKAGQQSGSGQEVEEEALPRHKGKVRAQQDVAGSLRTDRQNLRTAELEQLFKVPPFQGQLNGAAGAAPAGV